MVELFAFEFYRSIPGDGSSGPVRRRTRTPHASTVERT